MRTWPRLAFLVWLIFVVRLTPAQAAVQYVYDELGRLIAVIDTSGDTAVYHYDAVGNVLSIARHASSQVSIISFTPGEGPIGTQVRIFGTGFSSTIAQDTVTFNGTTATISSATSTQLVVTVPSGATTGTIGVTAPGGSATSAASFTVASPAAPTITSFSPSTAVAGTSVSVTGTNFDTTASHDRVKINATLATVASVTSTSLGTTVPASTGSGPISIATPLGAAVSSTDLFVAPPPYTSSDIGPTSRLTMGSNQTVTIGTANRIGLVTFAGTAGQRFSLVASSGTFGGVGGCNLHLSVLKPNGTVLVPVACMGTDGFIDATVLPVTGTYTMLLEPGSTTGSVNLALYDASDATGTIIAGGSAVTASTSIPGQNVALTFSGTSGQRVSVLGASGSFTNLSFGCEAAVRIRKADGTALSGDACVEFGGFLDTVTLPATGTYAVVLDPASTATGSVSLTLYSVPADASASITAGGSAVTMTISTAGQNGALTFSGTSGQRISLLGSSSSFTNLTFSCELTVRLKQPGGSLLGSDVCMEFGGFLDATTLPTTGTYTIEVDPGLQSTGAITLTLYSVPSDASGTITEGGSAVTVTTTVPGQNAALTFSGTTSDVVYLQFSNVSYGTDGFYVSVLKPDTSVLLSPTWVYTATSLSNLTLPATGTYTIKTDPYAAATGSVDVSLRLPPTVLVNSTAPPTGVTVSPSASVTVGISNGPANTTDWVALAQVGTNDFTYVTWQYLNGAQWPPPSSGMSSATLTFTMPATTGNYEFRFFANNGYTKLATSTTVTVQ
jgi:YD repeat-containing protein